MNGEVTSAQFRFDTLLLAAGSFIGDRRGSGSGAVINNRRLEVMPEKTEKNLAYAFAAESKASVRNETFARKADADGYSQIGRLFRAVSEAESVHARRYLLLMRGKIGSTEENLETAFRNEIKANVEEYPKLIKDASDEGKEGVMKAFSQSRDVEDRHAELYKKAMNDMLSDRETEYYVCQVCGYVSEDAPPDKCPVCGAVKGKFKRVT
jgi:rubrerythrin